MGVINAIDALRAALAEPTVKESLQVESAFAENATTQQQLEEAPPSDYRRGYWDGFEIGKREGRIEAENALAEPVQEPVAWRFEARHIDSAWAAAVTLKHPGPEGVYMRNVMPLYAHPPQRKPLTEEEIVALIHPIVMADMPDEMTDYEIARAIERAIKRAHGIGVQP